MRPSSFIRSKNSAAKLSDRLGKPIDPGILETVAVLRYHGIHTIASCEGHLDRVTGGPYVMFEAPEAFKLRQQYRELKDKESDKYKSLRARAIEINLFEIQKMLLLLSSFYQMRNSPNNQHLIIRSFDASVGELMCQSAGTLRILSGKERSDLLLKNQEEMHVFTSYLKRLKPIHHPTR